MVLGILFCFIPLILSILIFTFAFKLNIFHQLFAVLLGLLAVIPISLIQYFVPEFARFADTYPILYSLIRSLILYALIEEVIKMVFSIFLPSQKHKLNSFLLLGFVMGLAVGCFEQGVYFFEHLQRAQNTGSQLLYFPIFVRIFSAVLIHFSCTGLCAVFMYGWKNKIHKTSIMISAILIHGLYDFFAGFQSSLKIFAVAVVLYSLLECRIKYKNMLESLDKN